MKTFVLKSFIYYLVVIFLFASCKVNEPDSILPSQTHSARATADYSHIPNVLAGHNIYTGSYYRYGPSIIVNADNSIDAWFCAVGDTYGTRFYQNPNNNASPIRLMPSNHASNTAAQKFTSSTPFAFLGITCPSWGDSLGTLVLRLYTWRGGYSSTINDASALVASANFIDYADNSQLKLSRGTQFPSGDYLWVLSLPANVTDANDQIVGVWKAPQGPSTQISYLDGVQVDGAYQGAVAPSDGQPEGYLDQITHQRSTDGGQTWSAEVNTLKPNFGSADKGSVCDPSVAKWGGYYYMAYT
ncbi:MAG: hypothetical protein EOO89_29145, partial [Pedobacter sp.]